MKHHIHKRHKIGVPRGMLRHITLILLNETPLSGSEISEEIYSYMEWKPSPGSIYPLLSNLQEEGLIEPAEDSDPTLKRFSLTKKGEIEIEIHRHHDQEIRNRSKNIRKIYWQLLRRMSERLYESYVALQDQIEKTYSSSEDMEGLKAILDEATSKLRKMVENNIE